MMKTRIKEYRLKQNLTQEKLAEMVGVEPDTGKTRRNGGCQA